MNWADYVVLGILVGYAVMGYSRGFIYSVFKVASFFVSAFASVYAYPYVSKALISVVHLDQRLKEVFSENLIKIITPEQIANAAGNQSAAGIVNSWGLPKPIEAMVMSNLTVPVGAVKQSIVSAISYSLSLAAVNIISIIIVFAGISVLMFFAKGILQGIASLPIFKQINRTGGLFFGIIQGVLIIYVCFAVLALFSSNHEMQNVFTSINTSVIAKQFYTNNILLIWAFGAKK